MENETGPSLFATEECRIMSVVVQRIEKKSERITATATKKPGEAVLYFAIDGEGDREAGRQGGRATRKRWQLQKTESEHVRQQQEASAFYVFFYSALCLLDSVAHFSQRWRCSQSWRCSHRKTMLGREICGNEAHRTPFCSLTLAVCVLDLEGN